MVTAPYLVYSSGGAARELKEYTGSVWVQHLILCAVSVVVLLALVSIMLGRLGPSSLLPGLWVLIGATPLILLRQALRRMTIANLHVRSAVALDLVVAVVQLGGIVLLGLVGTLSVATIFAVMGGRVRVAGIIVYCLSADDLFVRRDPYPIGESTGRSRSGLCGLCYRQHDTVPIALDIRFNGGGRRCGRRFAWPVSR